MNRVFFEEKQKLPVTLRWIVIFSGLALCFPFFGGVYVRSILQEPWGKASWDTGDLIGVILVIVFIVSVLLWLVRAIGMEIKIEAVSVEYRLFPYQGKITRIEKQDIIGYEVRKIRWTEPSQGEYGKGYRKKSKNQVLVLRGRMAVELKLLGDQKLILGTLNPDRLRWAMKKLMSNP